MFAAWTSIGLSTNKIIEVHIGNVCALFSKIIACVRTLPLPREHPLTDFYCYSLFSMQYPYSAFKASCKPCLSFAMSTRLLTNSTQRICLVVSGGRKPMTFRSLSPTLSRYTTWHFILLYMLLITFRSSTLMVNIFSLWKRVSLLMLSNALVKSMKPQHTPWCQRTDKTLCKTKTASVVLYPVL